MSTGVETVLSVLESAGFSRLPTPLVVSGSVFAFDAAARGTVASHDLVVVARALNSSRRLVRLLSGLNRTLDQAESRRPVSLVLLGSASIQRPMLTELEQEARVFIIDAEEPTAEKVSHAIAVLMPLTLPLTGNQEREPLAEVTEILGSKLTNEHEVLIESAKTGPEEVEDALRRYVEAAVNPHRKNGPTDG